MIIQIKSFEFYGQKFSFACTLSPLPPVNARQVCVYQKISDSSSFLCFTSTDIYGFNILTTFASILMSG